MSRKFITGVVAISALVATLSASPARANDHDDIAKFLGAAATLFIIGKAIQHETHKDKKPKARHVETRPTLVHPNGGRHVQPRKPALPSSCLREVRGANTKYVMGGNCLQRNNIAVQSLPRACKIEVQGRQQTRNMYAVRCLRQQGYKMARW
jgi:hypothetical protein